MKKETVHESENIASFLTEASNLSDASTTSRQGVPPQLDPAVANGYEQLGVRRENGV
jgi:hypothetical protein